LQAEGKVDVPRYKSTYDAFATIWRKEGIKGLYRVSLLSFLPLPLSPLSPCAYSFSVDRE
jgi:hypothetical protein